MKSLMLMPLLLFATGCWSRDFAVGEDIGYIQTHRGATTLGKNPDETACDRYFAIDQTEFNGTLQQLNAKGTAAMEHVDLVRVATMNYVPGPWFGNSNCYSIKAHALAGKESK